MTSPDNKTTANRMYEVSNSISVDFYITINGDEPMIDPAAIKAVVHGYIPQDIKYGTNTICAIDDLMDVMDTSN